MEAGARSEPQERIAVAYEVYARTPRSVGPKISAAAQAAGVPRSRIYEFWSSAAHLGEDLAVFRATPETSWQAQVMAASDTDVFDAIRSAVQSPTAAAGVTARAVLSAEPIGSRPRARLQAAEDRWLRWLAERLRSTADQEAPVPWTVAAATITALVEGALLIHGPARTGTTAPLDAAFADVVAATAAGATAHFASQVTGADVALETDGVEHRPAPEAAQLLDRIVGALDEATGSSPLTDDRRRVSPKVLAAELGVSPRWIFGLWPATVDFNADLFEESLRRLSSVTDLAAMTAFSDATITDPSQVSSVLVRINEHLMDVNATSEPLIFLSLLDLLGQAEVAGRSAETIQAWAAGNQVRAAAILGATNRKLIPGVSLVDYADLGSAIGVGGWRLCATHRELIAHRCTYLGEDVAAIAAGLDAITKACTRPM